MSNFSGTVSPYSWPPSQTWDGNAGSFSSFIIRAGTPAQDFKVFPGTDGNQIWLPVPEGCLVTDPPNCGDLRGVLPYQGLSSNGFQKNQSSTWIPQGIYNIDIENGLNLTGNGDIGYDTVGLALQNSNGLRMTHQLLVGIATKDYYLGVFGLGTKPTNLSTFDEPIPNYMQSLRNENLIPSLSYGYTAGAKYQLDGVFGSLTLGGYDSSRLNSSNITIPFSPDDSRQLTVGVQSVIASATPKGDVMPLPNGAFFLIDSSVTDIWLPLSACQLFEDSFGLTYDNTTDLYTVNASMHKQLQALRPTISFVLGAAVLEGTIISVTFPYAAFDLQASSPFYSNATQYFPIRRAANASQYTLGRVFLQEAYITVDYERSHFSVAQAVFDQERSEKLETIPPLQNGSQPSEGNKHAATASPHSPISRGALTGIIIAIVIVVLTLLSASGLWVFKHRRRKPPQYGQERGGHQTQNIHTHAHVTAVVVPEPTSSEEGSEADKLAEISGLAIEKIELGGTPGVRRSELEACSCPVAELDNPRTNNE